MKAMKENLNLPFQVENLIKNMLDKSQSEHIRNNYRQTLDGIAVAIQKAIRQHDTTYEAQYNLKRKGR
jgi:hypothetical protein